jgi:hypothetical protein
MSAMILGIALLAALVFFLRWYATASPGDLLKTLKWCGLTVGGLIVLFMMLRGGFQFLWFAAAFLIPYLLRRRGMRAGIETAHRGATIHGSDTLRCDGTRSRYWRHGRGNS